MLSYTGFEKTTMTRSQGQDCSIPEDYKSITVPNKEAFHHLLADCRLENNGDKLHIHIPKETFNTLIELLHIITLSGYIE